MNRKHASIALVVMSLLCAAAHGQGTPPSQEGGDGEETSSRCGRWHEGPLNWVITSAVPPKQLELVDGSIGCSTIPCTLAGWRRWTRFLTPSSPFEVRNKLWFFNTDSDDPVPSGSEYGGNANSTDESRDHNGSAKWSRRYTYTRGEYPERGRARGERHTRDVDCGGHRDGGVESRSHGTRLCASGAGRGH